MAARRRPLGIVVWTLAVWTGCESGPIEVQGTGASASAAAPAPAPPPVERPPGPDALTLLDPLREGAEVEGFRLDKIRLVEEGFLRLAFANEGGGIEIDVALASDEAPMPPAVAGPYAVYFRTTARAAEADRLAKHVAGVLEKGTTKPLPTGLAAYPRGTGRELQL